MSARRWHTGVAKWSALLGLAMLAASLVTRQNLVLVAINTVVQGSIYWGVMSGIGRSQLCARLELSSAAPAGVPATSPVAAVKRHLPWIILLTVVLLGISFMAGTGPTGIVLGTGIWFWGDARRIGHWEQEGLVEALVPVRRWQKGGIYHRPLPVARHPGRSGAENLARGEEDRPRS